VFVLAVEICRKINSDSGTADVKVLGLVYNKSPCFCPVFGKVMKISGKWPI
jgi:hypothetical protein